MFGPGRIVGELGVFEGTRPKSVRAVSSGKLLKVTKQDLTVAMMSSEGGENESFLEEKYADYYDKKERAGTYKE